MNKPKITFGAIKLNVGASKEAEEKKEEPPISGKLNNFKNAGIKIIFNRFYRFWSF